MGKPLRVLIVEDSEIDSLFLLEELRKGGFEPSGKRVETLDALSAALDEETWDIIAIDYTLPTFTGIDVLKLVRQRGIDIPSIVVSGTIDDETAVAAMKAGARDYIMKTNLARLGPAVERELREANERRNRRCIEEALRESEERFRRIVNMIYEGIREANTSDQTIFVNRKLAQMLGYSPEEILDRPFTDFMFREDHPDHLVRITRRADGLSEQHERRFRRKDGTTCWALVSATPLRNETGQVTGFLAAFADITERKRTEDALRLSREQLRAFAGRMQAAREEERTQIAREIHDEMGGALTAMKIDSSLLARTVAKVRDKALRDSLYERMNEMTNLIDETMRTVRRIATALRPGILDDLGLMAALEWQLTDFQKRTGIRCEFTSSGESVALEGMQATALFRIAQEALTNVARHARATEVRIRLQASASTLLLEVEDNGVGIKEEEIQLAKSLGLLGMRERALSFGGRVTITGRPGEGTTVAVESPPAGRGVQDQEDHG